MKALLLSLTSVLMLLAAGRTAHAQTQSGGGGTRAIQLPLSGQQVGGGAVVQQVATPTPGTGTDTISSQIQVQGPYTGSVPGSAMLPGAISLTVEQAVERGLQTNLGKIAADAGSMSARAQWQMTRSALLPDVNASISENAAKVSLTAEGFSASALGASLPFQFPSTVGPFHYYDAHASFHDDLIDLTAMDNLRAAHQTADAAVLNAGQARQEVTLAVAGVCLQLMANRAMVNAQKAEVEYAEASYKQARAQVDAGNKAPIEADRNLVEMQIEKQRLEAQQGDLEKEKNNLARMIGLPLGRNIEIADQLSPLSTAPLLLNDAIQRAWSQRKDLRGAEAQLRAAEEARQAARAERLPTVSVGGQYGLEGVNPNHGSGVFQASASINIPIFQGGRIHADVAQADAVLTQRRAEVQSERSAVELQVRNAYIDLGVADTQVATAGSNRKLALSILQQSQDRFRVGVADSVEVVNSEEALAAADHDYVSSLFSQYLARITLDHAMGEATNDISDLFRSN